MRRVLLFAGCALGALGSVTTALGSVTTAHAAVHVRVAADAAQNPVSSVNAYTITTTTDSPVNLGFVKVLLPGHGAPPIEADIYGQPRDTDDDTQFAVLDAHGGEVSGRWVSWPIFAPLLPGGVVVERVDVLTPALGAFFQAGATATIDEGASDALLSPLLPGAGVAGSSAFPLPVLRDDNATVRRARSYSAASRTRAYERRRPGLQYDAAQAQPVVDGTRRGAQIWNQQDTASLHTGGSATISGRSVTIDWWVQNGTSGALSLDTERFGVRAGAAYEGSTLDPVAKIRHVASLGVIWHTPIVLAAGERVDFSVRLTSPCGIGQVGARLRVYAGAILAGTGDAGPHWKLPDCEGERP